MPLNSESTPEQKDTLKLALSQHAARMAVKDTPPEEVPQDFSVPTYNENFRPLYDGQLFPAVSTPEDLIRVGYATQEGQATPEGLMAISLKEAGGLNDDYTLNNAGRAMLASPDDLLKEENIDLYRESKKLDLAGQGDIDLWDEIKNVGASVVKGANVLAENELQAIKDIASSDVLGGAFTQYGAEKLTPEKRAESRIIQEEAIKDIFRTSATAAKGAATAIDKVAAKAMYDGMMQDYQVAYLDQKFDRDMADIEKVNTSEVADELAKVVGLGAQFAEGRQKAEEILGQEATQQATEKGQAAGLALSLVNPLAPEALTARVGFEVARAGTVAAFKPIARGLLNAESKAAEALAAGQRVTGLNSNLAKTQYVAKMAEEQAVFAERQADKLSKMGLADRANAARQLANGIRTKGMEAGAKIQGLTDEIARASDEASKLAKNAAVADKINFVAQRARELPGLPIQAVGGLVEGTGRAMIALDKGLSTLASKVGADKAWNAMNKVSSLSGLGGAGYALGLGPVAMVPAAIRTAWSTAPFLKGAGNFVRMVGKETANARGQIPFWQRVANYPQFGATQRAVAHLMDTATLGGRVTGAAGRVGKGLAASYPVDLAFEWISEGGNLDENTFKRAAAETVVFGGTGAALGGITAGSQERIKQLQRGDAMNFYRGLQDGQQRVAFNSLKDGMKRGIGTYSASFPNLNIKFTDQGGGAFDKATNTAFINPMSRNPLKPLLAHEINHYLLVRNQMEGGVAAALVGDGYQTGGLLRGKDGKLDENFLAFKDEYTRRLQAQHENSINQRTAAGEKIPARERTFTPPDDNYMAVEYFVDSMADDMVGLVESGELGKQAGQMLVNRKMKAFGDSILQKAPIIRDFFYKLGGATDKNGKAVYGNGLLAEGIREIPEMKRMFRKMISESAGRPMHVAKVTKGESEGYTLPISGKDDPILGEMPSLWETDKEGVPLKDKNGEYIPLSDATEQLRASAGLILAEDQQNRINRGETLEAGELRYNPEENAWTGDYLTDRQLQLIRTSGRFNNAQLKQLELLNGAAQENTGRRFFVINQAALKKNRKGKWKYDQIKPSMREIVPYGVKITKDGNILINLMSVQQLHANVFEKAASKRGQSLYKSDAEAILADVNQVIENHGRNEPTDAYFKSKYGGEWEMRKNFINTVFGNVGKGQKDINPLLGSGKVDRAVVRTYRIDRINKATELEGRTNLPYQNHLVKVNFMPEGEPILDENGEPKDLRYTPSYEESAVAPKTSVRMPEARQMPEGEQTGQTRFMPEGVDEDKFYSQLDRVISDKIPSRATPQQIMATLDPARGSGVKAEEIKWSGLEQAMKSLEKDGKVSKEDLLKYLRDEGRVRFEEVTLGNEEAYDEQRAILGEQWATKEITFDEWNAKIKELEDKQKEPKFSQYVLPGGENYREVVLAMPNKNLDRYNELGKIGAAYMTDEQFSEYKQLEKSGLYQNSYTSSHFPDIPNYVAHMRVNERVDDNGKSGLFIEELQSDRHQEGRKKGYASDKPSKEEVINTRNEIWRAYDAGEIDFSERNYRLENLDTSDGVADAPFRTTWPLQLFKRALRDAVDSGKDWVGWTTGDTQAERYNLSKQVKSIDWSVGRDGLKVVDIKPIDAPRIYLPIKDGKVYRTADRADFRGKGLDEIIGKEVAQRIVDSESGSLKGDGLNIGGGGMKSFYDKMVPTDVQKYVKQWGGKVEKTKIEDVSDLRKYVENYDAWREYVDPEGYTSEEEFNSMSESEKLASVPRDGSIPSTPIWRVDITPEMRKISKTGQMRFMPEAADVSPEDLNPVANRQEAEGLFADGKSLFAFNEMEETVTPITSREMLNAYPPDAIGWMEPASQSAMRFMPEGYKSHHDETLIKSAWNGKELDLSRPFKANESLPSLAMRTKWEEKPIVKQDSFDFKKKASVVFGKNKNGNDVTLKFDPKLINAPNIVDFADVYAGEQIQYTIADRMSAVDGDMGGPMHPFLKNNDVVITGPDNKQYVVAWGNNSATVGTKMRRKAQGGAKVLMVYLMGNDAHQSNTRTVRLFDAQLENSSKPGHMIDIARAYAYIPIKEIKHASALKEVSKMSQALQKAQKLKKDSSYIDELRQKKKLAIENATKFKVSAYEKELAGIFRKVKSSQTRLDNGIGKQSTVDANIKELDKFATSAKGTKLIKEIPSKFIYEMTNTFDGRKSAVSQISNLKLYDFDGTALSSATADMVSADKNAIVTAIDLSKNPDFFMLYMGDDPKQINAMTSSEKAAAAKLKQNSDFVVHEAYDTLILSPLDGRRNLNSRMENALDAVPESFQAVLNDRPSVKAQVGKKDAKGKLILSEDNLLNTVRDQNAVPLIYNPKK